MKKSIRIVVCASVLVLLIANIGVSQTINPFTQEELKGVLKFNFFSMKEMAKVVRQRGVDFQMTAAIEKDLRGIGAYNELIEAVRDSYRTSPNVEPSSPSAKLYFDLLERAVLALLKDRIEESITLLEDAAKLDPERPTAYQYLAVVQLYKLQSLKGRSLKVDRETAERNMRMAIERGGEVMFPVAHNHILATCAGFFIVRKSSIAYQPLLPFLQKQDDAFDVEKKDIKEIDACCPDKFKIKVPHPRKMGEAKSYLFIVSDDFFSKFYPKLITNLIKEYQ